MQLGSATTGAGYGYGFSRKLAEPTETLIGCQQLALAQVSVLLLLASTIERVAHTPRGATQTRNSTSR